MRRGFDQPTSSSASRSSNTSAREQKQRTRQDRNDAPSQADSISARRKSSNRPNLILPPQSDDVQSAPQGHKSPAYLEGKNPYGQILDDIDHPYRKPKTTGGVPTQLGATSSGRLRTSGSFHSKTRPESKPEPEREVSAPNSLQSPLFPRTPAKPISVRAARDFFESKASSIRSAPPFPPPAAATAKGASAKTRVSEEYVHNLPHRRSRDKATRPDLRIAIQSDSDIEPVLPSPPPEASTQLEPSQLTNRLALLKGDSMSNVDLRKATALQDTSAYNDLSSEAPRTRSGERHPTNFLATASRDTEPLDKKQRSVGNSSKADNAFNTLVTVLEHTDRADNCHVSDETVSHRYAHSMTAAESDQEAAKEVATSSAHPSHTVRRAVEEDHGFTAKQFSRRKSYSAPLTHEGTSAARTIRSRPHRSLAADLGRSTEDNDSTGPGDVLGRVLDNASNSFSHDGSGSTPSLSRRSTAPSPTQIMNEHIDVDEPNITVPEHVDWRSAYGRRRTQDFGFPGARIKPGGTFRTYKPLQNPDKWTKRACGHFSFMDPTESREHASKRLCHQCRTKSPPPGSKSATQQRTWRRVATESLSLSSYSSKKADGTYCRSPGHRKNHSECPPAEKCCDALARDVGNIIDAILEEHTNTLQDVINSIRHAEPSLSQLRRKTENPIQRYQVESAPLCHTPCRSSRAHKTVHQPYQTIRQPVGKAVQQVYE
ncbi:uncharacterized protein EKO05_0004515 [Ascochyta rabiei]|uniref:uncharacterized protein n=1 Tax=Didymella rabiei TaxID=5454 RepID=UPI00220CE7D9|nr:uncharacterized protein EKO05_0004515 [Ascochyta rabiei]UPX14022.1 hypothetical protein EKO05_0004515 [Ascochyta rabiei]